MNQIKEITKVILYSIVLFLLCIYYVSVLFGNDFGIINKTVNINFLGQFIIISILGFCFYLLLNNVKYNFINIATFMVMIIIFTFLSMPIDLINSQFFIFEGGLASEILILILLPIHIFCNRKIIIEINISKIKNIITMIITSILVTISLKMYIDGFTQHLYFPSLILTVMFMTGSSTFIVFLLKYYKR